MIPSPTTHSTQGNIIPDCFTCIIIVLLYHTFLISGSLRKEMASGRSHHSNSSSTQETKGYCALQGEAPKGQLYQTVQIWTPDTRASPSSSLSFFPSVLFFPVYGPSPMPSTSVPKVSAERFCAHTKAFGPPECSHFCSLLTLLQTIPHWEASGGFGFNIGAGRVGCL